MDKYVSVVKSSSACATKKEKRYSPYPSSSRQTSPNDTDHSQTSSSVLTKFLLSTLSDDSNPITHSDIGKRTDHVVSTSSGHQVSEIRVNSTRYMETRRQKLTIQREAAAGVGTLPSMPLKNVRVYINGFLGNTTDIELKRAVVMAGGVIMDSPSGATHIITSQNLSASTTQKIFTAKSKRAYVVYPDWVYDSIKTGQRKLEREYAVFKNTDNRNVYEMLRK